MVYTLVIFVVKRTGGLFGKKEGASLSAPTLPSIIIMAKAVVKI